MFRPVVVFLALASLGAGFAVDASSSSSATKQQAEKAGWDCAPDVEIGGYFHCAAPGKPSLQDLIDGDAAPPSLQLRAYDADTERYAGTETLRREDLFSGDSDTACPQDPGTKWVLLEFTGADYFACHRFDA